MTWRKIICYSWCVVELLLILFCCVWWLCETVHDLKLPRGGNDGNSIVQAVPLSNGKVIKVVVLDDAFAWPLMRRNKFHKKCVVASDDGKRYVRIIETSCDSLVAQSLRRISEVGNVQDINEFLELSSFETQTMEVISFYLMVNAYLFLVVIALVFYGGIKNLRPPRVRRS